MVLPVLQLFLSDSDDVHGAEAAIFVSV